MIRYSLKQLRYFVAAAELRSTCAAARFLHVSQPSVSGAIKQLEATFGQVLVVRHKGQGITPTPYGWQLMVRSKQLLNNVGITLETVRLTHPEPEKLGAMLSALNVEHLVEVISGSEPGLSFVLKKPDGEQIEVL